MRRLIFLITTVVSVFGAEHRITVSPGAGAGSLEAVLGSAREYRKSHADDAIVIELQGGRYELKQPITLTAEDSNFSFVAAKSQRPVLSGGRLITGWKRDAKNQRLWHATVPEVQEGKWYFRQLFINGERKTRARTPNTGFYRIDGESPQSTPLTLKFKNDEIKARWAALSNVEVVAYFAWSDVRMQIRAVDLSNHVATLSGSPRPSNRENNAQYFIENAPDALDSAGEWYLDQRTGVVSYWADNDKDLNQAEVVAPKLDRLIKIAGDSTKKLAVRSIKFQGIEFSHTDWQLGDKGYADTQAAVEIAGDVAAQFAEKCEFQSCKFTHLAGYGLELGAGCKNFKIRGNEMRDLGAGGIRVGVPQKASEPFSENNSHQILDNHLSALGRVYAPAVGILIMQSGTNRVAHNEINDLYYTAISVGWNWGYQETPCRENIIEFNHLHHIGQGLLSDMGAIYTLGIQHGTVIRNNLIHDVNAFTYGGWGLYTDEGSTGILLENNVVYRCKSAGFHQHYGRDNILRNNIFAFNVENQLMRTREEAHTSFIFTNNIVYFNSGKLLGSNWSNDHYVMDSNLYYDERLGKEQEKMTFAGASLTDWRKRGHDTHSLLENPRFKSAAKDDFRLDADSPALKLGFKPIDLSKVGVRSEGDRKD